LYPVNLATLAVANVFDTSGSYWGPGAATLPEVAFTDDSENYLFVGASPTLVLLWFGISGGGAWRPGRRLMTFILAATCLFMLGRYAMLYELAFKFLPGIDLFRRPTDASFLFRIAFAFLVGHAIADYVREGLPRLRPISTVMTVAVAAAIVAFAIAFSARTGHALASSRAEGLTRKTRRRDGRRASANSSDSASVGSGNKVSVRSNRVEANRSALRALKGKMVMFFPDEDHRRCAALQAFHQHLFSRNRHA
jgi:hypothetical protein